MKFQFTSLSQAGIRAPLRPRKNSHGEMNRGHKKNKSPFFTQRAPIWPVNDCPEGNKRKRPGRPGQTSPGRPGRACLSPSNGFTPLWFSLIFGSKTPSKGNGALRAPDCLTTPRLAGNMFLSQAGCRPRLRPGKRASVFPKKAQTNKTPTHEQQSCPLLRVSVGRDTDNQINTP